MDAAIQEKYFRDLIDVWGYGLCVQATLFPRMQSELDSFISVADPGFSAERRPEVPIIHVANFSEKEIQKKIVYLLAVDLPKWYFMRGWDVRFRLPAENPRSGPLQQVSES